MMLRVIRASWYSNVKIPPIDVSRYIEKRPGWQYDCRAVAETLKTYGLVIIKDPRVNQA
jgi:hypothetical protein